MKKALAVIRVSSEGQTKRAGAVRGYSLEVQREGAERKAQELGATIVKEIAAPAQSASKGMYPALREALEFIKAEGDIDYLIFYELDRFAREEQLTFNVVAELRAAQTQLVSVLEPLDLDTPEGMLNLGLKTIVNAYRSRGDGRKIKDGLRKKAEMGGTPCRARLGYLNRRKWDGANDIRDIVIDEERAPHIRFAFEAYATADWPLRLLADELYERGLRSRPTRRHPEGATVGVSSLQRILRDRYYIGIVTYSGIEYEGTHSPLVDEDTFSRVQQILSARAIAGEHQWKHQHHLKGTVFCGICGRRLKFTRCTGRHGGQYDYFVCAGRHNGASCHLPYLPAHRVDHFVAEFYVNEVKLDAERVAVLQPRLVEVFRLTAGYREQEAARHRRNVENIEGQRRQLVADHVKNPGAIPLDVLEQQQAELAEQLSAAQKELRKAEADVGKAEKGLRLARKFLEDSSGTYRDEADPLTRRHWNQVFFRRIFVGTHGIKAVELTDEFGALLRDDLAEEVEVFMANPTAALRAGGSTFNRVVEAGGIEPPTPACKAGVFPLAPRPRPLRG